MTQLSPIAVPMSSRGAFTAKTVFVPPVEPPIVVPEPIPPHVGRSRRSRFPRQWWETMPLVDPLRNLRRRL